VRCVAGVTVRTGSCSVMAATLGKGGMAFLVPEQAVRLGAKAPYFVIGFHG
jgi:hypothetical protein